MNKLNRRGFTLVELLITIVILSLVIGFSAYGVISAVKNSKGSAYEISTKSIKEAARTYSGEANPSDWKDISDYSDKYFCVTIRELINKGLLNEDDVLNPEFSYSADNYVAVIRNKATEVITKEEIVDGTSGDGVLEGICNGTIKNEVITSDPSLGDYTSYTDEIVVPFTDPVVESEIVDRICYYGESTSNLSGTGEIINGNCDFDGLEDDTPYYVKICMETERKSVVCSGIKEVETLDIVKPIITQTDINVVKIDYDDTNINGTAGHYFNSSLEGTVSTGVFACTLKNDVFSCGSVASTSISSGKWYKTNDDSISVTYEEDNVSVVVKAQTRDESNNKAEAEETFNIKVSYVVSYDANGGVGAPASQTKIKGKSLTLTSDIPVRTGYTFTGWKDSSGNSYSSSGTYTKDADVTLYAQWRINKVYVKFNVEGGEIVSSTQNSSGTKLYTWTTSNGTIFRSLNGGSATSTFFSIDYDSTTGESGLPNYNNSSYMKITKTNYAVDSGSEWLCKSGCKDTGAVYSQSEEYSHSDFCDASNGDCTVELSVNWISTNDTIGGDRYYCDGSSEKCNLVDPFYCDKFYVTSCNTGTGVCNYTQKNGVAKVGTVVRNQLALLLAEAKCSNTYYVTTSLGLNCRKTPTSDGEVVTTFSYCSSVLGGKTSTLNSNGYNWHYNLTYNCYYVGAYVSETSPCSSSGDTGVGLCGTCVKDTQCSGNLICSSDSSACGSSKCCNYSQDTISGSNIWCGND